MADAKKYLDLAGLSKYDELIKGYVDSAVSAAEADTTAVSGRVSALETLTAGFDGKTVKAYADSAIDSAVAAEKTRAEGKESALASSIESAIAKEVTDRNNAIDSAKSAIDNAADALETRVSTNESAIAVLNGTKTQEGSVAYQIAQVVAGADESFDTLKEIADWIKNDTTGAAKMANDISSASAAISAETSARTSAVASALAKLEGDDATEASARQSADSALQANMDALFKKTVEGETTSYSGTIKTYVDSAVSAAQGDATSGLESATTRISAEEVARASAIAKEVTDRNSAITSAVAAERATASAKESALDSAIKAETSARTSAVAAEETRASAKESAIEASIDALFSGEGTEEKPYAGTIKTFVDSAVASAKTAEENRASAKESALDAAIKAEKSARESAIDALDATVSQDGTATGLTLQVVEADGKLTSVSGSIATIGTDEINALFTSAQE